MLVAVLLRQLGGSGFEASVLVPTGCGGETSALEALVGLDGFGGRSTMSPCKSASLETRL